MIIGNNPNFFIQTDIINATSGFKMGTFNLWIDGVMYPRKGVDITLGVVLGMLIDSFERSLRFQYKETNLDINKIYFSKVEIEENNLYFCLVDPLYELGLKFFIEINGSKVRFFYSQDNSEFKAIEFPKDYLKELIKLLYDEIEKIKLFPKNYNVFYTEYENKEKNRLEVYKITQTGKKEWYLNVPDVTPLGENES